MSSFVYVYNMAARGADAVLMVENVVIQNQCGIRLRGRVDQNIGGCFDDVHLAIPCGCIQGRPNPLVNTLRFDDNTGLRNRHAATSS